MTDQTNIGFDCGPVPFDPTDCILTGVPNTTLQQWLTDAQAAYNSLMLGTRVVTVSIAQGDGSRTVSFTPADRANLVQYIRLLQAALGLNTMGRRPVRFNFA
jgi:hypothetical protein